MKYLFFLFFVASTSFAFALEKNTDPYVQVTGKKLLEHCDNYGTAKTVSMASREQGFCEGYIFGVIESLPSHCIPASTAKLTIVETIRAYIKRHTTEQKNAANNLVANAVNESWQCPKSAS